MYNMHLIIQSISLSKALIYHITVSVNVFIIAIYNLNPFNKKMPFDF